MRVWVCPMRRRTLQYQAECPDMTLSRIRTALQDPAHLRYRRHLYGMRVRRRPPGLHLSLDQKSQNLINPSKTRMKTLRVKVWVTTRDSRSSLRPVSLTKRDSLSANTRKRYLLAHVQRKCVPNCISKSQLKIAPKDAVQRKFPWHTTNASLTSAAILAKLPNGESELKINAFSLDLPNDLRHARGPTGARTL